jgi:hypothetical protein
MIVYGLGIKNRHTNSQSFSCHSEKSSMRNLPLWSRRRHERKLNTIHENPQMTQMTQIFYL